MPAKNVSLSVTAVIICSRCEVFRLRVRIRRVVCEVSLRLAAIPDSHLDELPCHKPTHVSTVSLHIQIRVDQDLGVGRGCAHIIRQLVAADMIAIQSRGCLLRSVAR